MYGSAGIRPSEVHSYVENVLRSHLHLSDFSEKCKCRVIVAVLFYAAARITSLFGACARLFHAPSHETLRKAVLAMLPGSADLQRRIDAALTADLPRGLLKRPQRIAIDIHQVPYHGEPLRNRNEVCRGKPRRGTSHFHDYATAYVVRKGYRFTVAMIPVRQNDGMRDVVHDLLQRVRRAGISIRLVLLDRGFFNAAVVRYLQSARYPFLMPVKSCGRLPKDPKKASRSSRRFWQYKKSGWSRYSWKGADGRAVSVRIAISCRNYAGCRKAHGRFAQVYAYGGIHPGCIEWVRATYRLRFGIEASYRQLERARIRTSSRDPLRRLFFTAVALILRNAWVWLHLMRIGVRHGDAVTLQLHLLRFAAMLDELAKLAEQLLKPEAKTVSQLVPP